MVQIRNFRSLKCWFARGHAWAELGRANHWRCDRCGRRAFSYFWDWRGGQVGTGAKDLPW